MAPIPGVGLMARRKADAKTTVQVSIQPTSLLALLPSQ
jgi:hypothetical protein